jgi:outer membrane protein assembly factor BamB
VYAEPLVVGGSVIVATENDTVYALDAASGRQLWHNHLGTPVKGGLPCGNIEPSGITGTPVVDAARGTVYAVAFERGPQHVLFALDLATGKVRWHRAIDAPGADPHTHQQRAALVLSGGRVYVAYGGLYGDCGQYHGRVVSAPASAAGGQLVVYTVPTGREGGIWAPQGPSVDAAGNLYVTTGNGDSRSFDWGNAVIRLSPLLHATAYFAPRDSGKLNGADADLGSAGPLLLPGARLFQIGKSGTAYLLDANALGGIGGPVASVKLCSAVFGGMAYANGVVYVPCTDGLEAVSVGLASLTPRWTQSAVTQPPILAGKGLWAVGGGTLYQLAPGTGKVRFSAPIGGTAHFATPAAAGGRVFVAAGSRVLAFA